MNTELLLKELETAYERKKKAIGKGMTKDEMKEALRDGRYRILFPEEDEDLPWYELVRFTDEETRQEALKELEQAYFRIRARVVLGSTDSAKEFLLS